MNRPPIRQVLDCASPLPLWLRRGHRLPVLAFLALLILLGSNHARADAIVGDCNQVALSNAVAIGGRITFACDGAITLTNQIIVRTNVVLDASGHRIILDAGAPSTGTNAPSFTNLVRLFQVNSGASLTITNVTLVNGHHTNGGAIYVQKNGRLVLYECAFSNNIAFSANAGAGARGRDKDGTGSSGRDGGSARSAAGGAIYNLGTAEVIRCLFVTNSAFGGNGGNGGNGGSGGIKGGNGGRGGSGGSARGGAVYNKGAFLAIASTFQRNLASGGDAGSGGTNGSGPFPSYSGKGGTGGGGAGAAIFTAKSIELLGCTFALNNASSGNSTGGGSAQGAGPRGPQGPSSAGGGLCNYGSSAIIVDCTFFANRVTAGNGGDGGSGGIEGGSGGAGGSGWGGNIFNAKRMSLTNCTLYSGGATAGARGVAGAGPFAGKDGKSGASRGGNICNSNGICYLKNTLIAFALPGTNGYGKFKDIGFNLSSDRSIFLRGMGSMTNTDPVIGNLGRNGGATETIPLLTNSPAIDKGDPTNRISFDQRGVTRPLGPRGDIGAYEYGLTLLPPVILAAPSSLTAQVGARVMFTVVAQADPPVVYQWRRGTTNLLVPNANVFTLNRVAASDAGANYSVVVGNNAGSVTSAVFSLTIIRPVSISSQPTNFVAALGATATFSVTATGDPPLNYQWFFNGQFLGGANLPTLTLPNVGFEDEGLYHVRVFNSFSSITSTQAILFVLREPPAIVTEPADVEAFSGENPMLTVEVSGSQPLSYQWYYADQPIAGATGATLTIPNAQTNNAGEYFVVVTNFVGSAMSRVATVTIVESPPVITAQPSDVTAYSGNPVTFTVEAIGSRPFTYQWSFNSQSISGATDPTLTLASVQTNDAGAYQVIIINAFGMVASEIANLAVDTSAPILTNDSTAFDIIRGTNFNLEAGVAGSGPMTFQWSTNGEPIVGATNAFLSFTNVAYEASGDYEVIAMNEFGALTNTITLTVVAAARVTCPEDEALCLIEFSNEIGYEFFLEFRDDPDGEWMELGDPVSSDNPGDLELGFTDDSDGASPERFYRVIAFPIEE